MCLALNQWVHQSNQWAVCSLVSWSNEEFTRPACHCQTLNNKISSYIYIRYSLNQHIHKSIQSTHIFVSVQSKLIQATRVIFYRRYYSSVHVFNVCKLVNSYIKTSCMNRHLVHVEDELQKYFVDWCLSFCLGWDKEDQSNVGQHCIWWSKPGS